MCQYIVECNNNCTTLITQVSDHMTNGAVYFYLNNYFKIIDSCHYLIIEQKNKFGNSICHKTDELTFMMSLVPIYSIQLFRYSNQSATTEKKFTQFLPEVNIFFENIDTNHMNENLAKETHKMYIHIFPKEQIE